MLAGKLPSQESGRILIGHPTDSDSKKMGGTTQGMPDNCLRQELIEFVERETIAEERKVLERHLPPVSTRVQQGDCIADVTFSHELENGFCVYKFKRNLSKFRRGDLLLINDGKPSGGQVSQDGTLVWLRDLDFEEKTIVVEKQNQTDPPKGQSCTFDKGFFDYNSKRIVRSVEVAFDEREDIAKLLLGQCALQPVKDLDQKMLDRHRSQLANFTEAQCQATAIAAFSPVTLIQGPPGSGKTHVLAEIITAALSRRKNVLVTAYTHRAIDNLLEAIAKRDCGAQIYKIGGIDDSQKLSASIKRLQFEPEILHELGTPCVVGATVYQTYKMYVCETPMFDLVVVDEAGQMPIAHANAALIKGYRFVIAGDHKQLAPVFHAEHPDHLRQSFFELLQLHYAHATVSLNTTFRMNDGINEFPNEAFYDGQLKPSPAAAARRFPAANAACPSSEAISLNNEVTFIKLQHRNAVQVSTEEARVVAQLACDLLIHHKVPAKELAIVSPHRAQNREIHAALIDLLSGQEVLRASVKQSLLIDTVERLQGQEREVIIFSLCSSKRSYLQNRAEFLFNPNRLNVAVTRSRTRLFIVGSENFFPRNSGVKLDTKRFEVFDGYHSYLESRSVRWE